MAAFTQSTPGHHTSGPSSPVLELLASKEKNEEEEEKQLLDEKSESFTLDTSSTEREVSRKFPGLRSPLKWNWRNIVIYVTILSAYLSLNISYSVIAPFFPKEAAKKGANSVVTGVIVSGTALCVVIFSPFFGYFLPRLGVRFTLLSGLFLANGAFVLLGFASMTPSGWVFITMCIILRLAQGVGIAMACTAAFAIPPVLFPESVGTVTGMMEVASGIGFASGLPIGGLLYAAGGFGVPFWVVGGVSLLFVPLCFMIVRVSSDSQQFTFSDLSSLWKLSKNLPFFVLLIGILLANSAFSFPFPVFQLFLNQEFGLKEEVVGFVLLAEPFIYLIFALLAGKLTDKLGPRYLNIAGFFLFGISYFLFGPAKFINSTPILWLVIFGYATAGIGSALAVIPVYPDLLNIAQSQMPDKDAASLTALVSGLLVSFYNAGLFVGPLAGGTLYQVIGFQTSATVFGEFLFAEGFLLLGITIIDKLRRRHTM